MTQAVQDITFEATSRYAQVREDMRLHYHEAGHQKGSSHEISSHESAGPDGTDEVVALLPLMVADLNFSITRDHRHVVVVRAAEVDTDIGAMRLRRTTHPE